MKLVINADDFGYTKSVSDGILYGYQHGIIRSTTALCNMEGIEYAAQLAKQAPDLGIGVHLTLTLGNSLTHGKTITEDGIKFKGRKAFYESINDLDMEEVYLEFDAQIQRFIEVFERMPDHIDSHHSIHDGNEALLSVSKRISEQYHVPMRRYSKFTYISGFFKETATIDTLFAIFEKHQDTEAIELMCHPGFCDLQLYQTSSYHIDRVKELDVLCSKEVQAYIDEHGIEVTNYRNNS